MDTVLRSAALPRPRVRPARFVSSVVTINAAILLALLVALFTVQSQQQTLRLGEVAGDTIVARHRVVYEDHAATAAKQRQARADVPNVLVWNTSQLERREQQAATFLRQAAPLVQRSLDPATKFNRLQQLLPTGVSAAALEDFPQLDSRSYAQVNQLSLQLLQQVGSMHIGPSQVAATVLGLVGTLPGTVTAVERTAISDILATFMVPTMVTDYAKTEQSREDAVKRVAPVTSVILPGEVIIARGDVVTSTTIDKLTALGLQSHSLSWRDIAGALLFAAVVLAMLFWYLHAFQRTILQSPRLLFLIDASILLTVAGARLVTGGHVLLPYFLPVAAISTFSAVLLAPEACVAITLTMAVLAGWVVANSFELSMYYFLSGAAGILVMRQVRGIRQFIMAGGYITAFSLATVMAFGVLDRSSDFAALREYLAAAVFNGFVSSALALGAFAVLADFFGVTTLLHLLELSQPSQPLLHRLMVRAPGTYNHSLIVSTMVERAAEEIGASSMLGKVMALYHDVGKVTNPHCFVENQMGMANIHDDLSAGESAHIIRGHVTNGLRLAKQYKMPRRVLDGIAEHHGTMLIPYFWHKARQEAGDAIVDSALYTYPGPKPQTKETALLMLADGCESAVRASSDHSHTRIGEIVRHIFEERIKQGQLDECPLTLRDLEAARLAFSSVLNGLYHPRIEYPEATEPAPAAAQSAR